jgi:hypothetical protein
MQIKLNEILTEISSATKEQKESISKMVTSVKVSGDTVTSAPAANTNTATTFSTTSAATTTAIPYVRRVSSLTLTEPFVFPIFSTPKIIASATASPISTNNPTRFISGLFDRSDDRHTRKSKFLEMDLDSDSSGPSKGDSNCLGSELQNQDDTLDTNVIRAVTDAPSDIPDPIVSPVSNSFRSINTNSRHHYHPLAHNYLNKQFQGTDFAPSESNSSQFHDGDETIRRIKENDFKGGRGEDKVEEKNEEEEEDLSQNQEYNEIKNLEIERLPLASEKNSNPEIEKIDGEILTALQRLGGSHESEDKENSSDKLY